MEREGEVSRGQWAGEVPNGKWGVLCCGLAGGAELGPSGLQVVRGKGVGCE